MAPNWPPGVSVISHNKPNKSQGSADLETAGNG